MGVFNNIAKWDIPSQSQTQNKQRGRLVVRRQRQLLYRRITIILTMIRYTKLFVLGAVAAVTFVTTQYTVDAFSTSSTNIAQQRYTTTNLRAIQETAEEGSTVQSFLQEKYPLFESLLLSR